MLAVYKFYANFGRHGEIKSVFIATQEEVKSVIGKEVHYSEPWGKYTSVSFSLEETMFTLITDKPDEVALIESLGILPSGHYSPLENLVEE